MQRYVELDEFYLPSHLCSAGTSQSDAGIFYRMIFGMISDASRAKS